MYTNRRRVKKLVKKQITKIISIFSNNKAIHYFKYRWKQMLKYNQITYMLAKSTEQGLLRCKVAKGNRVYKLESFFNV